MRCTSESRQAGFKLLVEGKKEGGKGEAVRWPISVGLEEGDCCGGVLVWSQLLEGEEEKGQDVR